LLKENEVWRSRPHIEQERSWLQVGSGTAFFAADSQSAREELREDIEASLEDVVLEKPLLRGVTPEPLSDWRTAGFSNEPVSFFLRPHP
jgi:hypothetical protein